MREGERARDREALAPDTRARKAGRGAEKVSGLTGGELAFRPKGRRGPTAGREVSRSRSSRSWER
jgi:hypothetical protein